MVVACVSSCRPGGDGLTPPKSGSAADNAEQNVWSNYDQLQHAPLTLEWVGTNERAARPKTWGGGRLQHHVECRAQRRPRHWKTRLRRPRRLEGGRERSGGGNGIRVRVGGGWGVNLVPVMKVEVHRQRCRRLFGVCEENVCSRSKSAREKECCLIILLWL